MREFLSDLAAVIGSIWMTHEPVRAVVRRRDITWETTGARGAYAKAV